jgi:hypothetical protein
MVQLILSTHSRVCFFLGSRRKERQQHYSSTKTTNPPESGTHNIRQTAKREEGTGITLRPHLANAMVAALLKLRRIQQKTKEQLADLHKSGNTNSILAKDWILVTTVVVSSTFIVLSR